MGQNVSQEQLQAHLTKQESLIRQLQAAVDKQGIQISKRKSLAESLGSGVTINNADLVEDETIGLEQKLGKAIRRRAEESDISPEEESQPNVSLADLTEEERQALATTKPWLAALIKPTNFEFGKTDPAPKLTLELEHIFGYRSNEVRNNLRWIDNEHIVYFAGTVGIVHDIKSNTQKFFRQHSDDILCLTFHSGRRVCATGEQGKIPSIYIWDVDTCKVVAKLAGFHRRGVSSLAFSDDGSTLLSVGVDDDNSVAVYDWSNGACLASEKTGSTRILGAGFVFSSATSFVTAGIQQLSFWELSSGSLTRTPATLGAADNETFLCVASTPEYTVVGTGKGDLYCFHGSTFAKAIPAHQTCVNSITADRHMVYCGGRDGFLTAINTVTGQKLNTVNLNKNELPEAVKAGANAVRAIDVIGADEPIAVAGTISGAIAVVNINKGTLTLVAQFHTGDLQKARAYGELGGLAASPTAPIFVSAGEDRTMRIWNAETRTLVKKVALTARAQTVTWSPDGKWIAVGSQDGRVVMFDSTGNDYISIRRTRRRVQVARFSADSTKLLVGTGDAAINLYDATKDFSHLKRIAVGSVPLGIDWSVDGTAFQVCTQSYELLFFQLDGTPIEPSAAKDIQWATQSCILGWDVQGVWPEGSDGTDVAAVSRSHDSGLLASVEASGTVKVFQFPCVGSGLDKEGSLPRRPHSVRATGHSGYLTGVQWSHDDQRLFTSGGTDLSIFQWRVVRSA
jgi:microtubule-associated protein-like 6